MFKSGHLPTLPHHDHRPADSRTLPKPRLPVVRNSPQSHKRSRPQIHLTLWQSANERTGHTTEHLNGLPSPNGRTNGTKESVGRTISPLSNVQPRRLEQMAGHGYHRTQQLQECHYPILTKPIVNRAGSRPHQRTDAIREQLSSGTTSKLTKTMETTSRSSPESNGERHWYSRNTLEGGSTGLAGSKE